MRRLLLTLSRFLLCRMLLVRNWRWRSMGGLEAVLWRIRRSRLGGSFRGDCDYFFYLISYKFNGALFLRCTVLTLYCYYIVMHLLCFWTLIYLLNVQKAKYGKESGYCKGYGRYRNTIASSIAKLSREHHSTQINPN